MVKTDAQFEVLKTDISSGTISRTMEQLTIGASVGSITEDSFEKVIVKAMMQTLDIQQPPLCVQSHPTN